MIEDMFNIQAKKHGFIYIFLNGGIDIFIKKLPWQENSAYTYTWNMEDWTDVSTLLGLISSAYRDLHHWISNQQPQYTEAEILSLGHAAYKRTEFTRYGKLQVVGTYIYIYIVIHRKICFVLSELISVARL